MSIDRLWGSDDIELLFVGRAKVVLPWPSASRPRDNRQEKEVIGELLRRPPVLHEVDPRSLLASQTWVLRQHAAYYGTGMWERTGTTSADMASSANRYPIVAEDGSGRRRIVTGHHRSLAALVAGRPVLVRLTTVPDAGTSFFATPHLKVTDGPRCAVDMGALADRLVEGLPIEVAEWDAAAEVLALIGLDPDQIADRTLLGRTGRISLGR